MKPKLPYVDPSVQRHWIYDRETERLLPVLTAQEARLAVDMLDNRRAAGTLTDAEYAVFNNMKQKLVFMQVAAERREA